MTDLTTEPGVDLSGSNVSAEVYAKVDMDGLNAAMKASGSKDTFVLHKNTYMSRYEKSTEPIVYNFQDAGNGIDYPVFHLFNGLKTGYTFQAQYIFPKVFIQLKLHKGHGPQAG